DGLGEDDARRPSLLPGWSIGHVLTHLARNADSVVRRLEGALAGDVRDQYIGGEAGRAKDIDAGAGRPLSELVADVRDTSAAVDELCRRLPAEAWGRMTRNLSGALQPASHVVFARWREVEVHLVDLGVGYGVDSWPDDLVRAWLPEVLAGLPGRSDPTRLLAWALGRAGPPELGDWG
ncbi:MAG: maleylpyruvate isomerase, partial [Frankiaceae bacterium]|nr:maleylpyruvate isomerase [Frankiaceae bacterium]